MQENYRYLYGEKPTTGVLYLRPEQIRSHSGSKKEGQDRNAIIRISESIKRYGILQPLSVRLIGDFSGFPAYELVDGERRLRAARLLGLEKLPCTVVSSDEKSCAIASVIEDLRQKHLHFFEQAAAFRLLTENYRLTQEEIARKVGVSQSAIANKLRLLRFSREEQHKIRDVGLTERHARALLRLKNPQKRAFVLEEIIAKACNVADTEVLIDALLAAEKEHLQELADTVSRETSLFASEKADIPCKTTPSTTQKPVVSMIITPETPPRGVCPRKFALQDLRPLYNSIERTLSIFRKTGQAVECRREEREDGVRIIIDIPRHA